ncbi:hypothetical protein HOLleu_31814 [Holothuria leucospilota]|uniref:Uncharacterized protein n=1 Tax=Holothuria leucospilota TaxID=206669 RepID=A0A9Q0YQY9_HOLLE|nr:hypothetical protein HOLleu_31814 [Holothuria leucospilota]
MWMCYGRKMNAFIFGGGQRSFGVTGGQTLKALLIRYRMIPYSKEMNPIVCGGVQRSSGVTRGQEAKFPKNSQEFPRIPKNSQDRHLGSPEVKTNFSRIPKIK